MTFPANDRVFDITEGRDKSDYCGVSEYNDSFVYGIYANQGHGTSMNDEAKSFQPEVGEKTAYAYGRHFETYNCKYCENRVDIVNAFIDSDYEPTYSLVSTYIKEKFPNKNPRWTAADLSSVCFECRSGCFQYCHEGCFAVCVQELHGCRTGNS